MLTPVRIYIDSHILMIYVNDTLSGSQDGYYDIYVCFVICSHSVVSPFGFILCSDYYLYL